MKKPVLLLLASALLAVTDDLPAQGTAFTYQGRLQNAGTPATGSYDFTFSLFNTNGAGGVQVGDTLTNLEVGVTNGLFTVALDFGPVWTGNPAWLAIGVRTNGDAGFQPLAPLQALTPAPYSIYSENAATVTGPIAVAQLPTALVTNGESSVALTGSFAGNGGGLTNLNPGALLQGIVVVTNVYTPGGTYTFPVPLGVTQMTVKLWGAGGGASGYTSGGGGAFSEVTEAVTAGQTYVVVVGQNGDAGGGAGANDASGGAGFGDGYGGNGGQGSSLFLFNRPAYIMQAVAGGGGGGGLSYGGNAGQTAGAISDYAATATTIGVTNLDLIGGAGADGYSNVGGGGGGGYGGGAFEADGQADGGGSYGTTTAAGSLIVPGNSTDPNYVAGTAYGGEDGAVVVIFTGSPAAVVPGLAVANDFFGSGAGLTSLNAASLTGTIAQANLGASGTYIPTLGDGTHNFATGINSGYYAKFGNLVYFEAWLTWSGKGSASGNLVISLPFTNQSSRPAFNFAYMTGITNATQIVADTLAGNTSFTVAATSSTGGPVTAIPVSRCAASGEIQVTGTYRWQ